MINYCLDLIFSKNNIVIDDEEEEEIEDELDFSMF